MELAKRTEDIQNDRHAEAPVERMFLNRWSPRSFVMEEIPDETLKSLFEAARWAPSAYNEQPWRFIIARTKEDREVFYRFIYPGNLEWCVRAPVLALLVSKKTRANGEPNRSHAFDAGTAWGFLALQAVQQGLYTHAMAGFQPEKAREELQIPDDFEPQAVIAIGRRGPKEALSEQLQEREKPSTRRPLAETVFEGRFGRPLTTGSDAR